MAHICPSAHHTDSSEELRSRAAALKAGVEHDASQEVSTATDVAKGAASVVLTETGLTNIVALDEQGRAIYQRILTRIISRTILKATFVAIAYIVTGKFVVSAFAMLVLTFILVADAGDFRLRFGLVPGCERCREGSDDQVARARGGRLSGRPAIELDALQFCAARCQNGLPARKNPTVATTVATAKASYIQVGRNRGGRESVSSRV